MWNYLFWEDTASSYATSSEFQGFSEADQKLFSPEDFISDDEAG